jgi:hypothetical protein
MLSFPRIPKTQSSLLVLVLVLLMLMLTLRSAPGQSRSEYHHVDMQVLIGAESAPKERLGTSDLELLQLEALELELELTHALLSWLSLFRLPQTLRGCSQSVSQSVSQ